MPVITGHEHDKLRIKSVGCGLNSNSNYSMY